jgi:hypothetical protein
MYLSILSSESHSRHIWFLEIEGFFLNFSGTFDSVVFQLVLHALMVVAMMEL